MNEKIFAGRPFRGLALSAVGLLMLGTASAQITERKSIDVEQRVDAFDNTTFCTAYLSDGRVFALRDIPVAEISNIRQLAFNPTGSSMALLREKKNIRIYSNQTYNRRLFELKEKRKGLAEKPYPVAMCYSPDARTFVVANTAGELVAYDTREYQPQAYLQGEAPASVVAMSGNNYFVVAGCGRVVDVWNYQTKKLRTSLSLTGNVLDVAFSNDASLLAVTTDDQRLTLFDTRMWKETEAYANLGGPLRSPSFHPEGKYIGVVKADSSIVVVNLKNHAVEQTLGGQQGVVKSGFFINRQTSDVFLLSNRAESVVFWDANGLNPFYGKLLNAEVDAKMNEWVKMMQGESMEEYAIRVNDETRLKQQQLFAQEVATEMAGDRISIENPFVGDYDASSSMLNIGFNTMPSIELEVPAEEVSDFQDVSDLSFENAVYTLNDEDEFVLAYVEVRNETTDKVYIYDNIGRTKLTAMEADENFVPLEVMQLASREEVQLKEIKEAVVEEKKQDKLITENTQIDVRTEVVPGVDADGNRILNYKVGYQYEVINKEFSAKEDFPSGGYDIERSNAAMSLMKIVKEAFEGDFAKYLSEGKQVKVIITGSADASPIRGRIAYRGQYGEFVDEPYYKDGNLDNITVTKASGITTNEQLALLRAAGVKNYIEANVSTLRNTQNEYEYHVEVAKERGGEFRKINVEFLIMDAFPVE